MIFFLIQNQIEQINPEIWVDLYADVLYHYAILRINNKNLAEDLVQDTFLSALKSIDQFQKKSSIQTWLISILKNKIIGHYRKNFNNSEIINGSDNNDEFNDFQENGMWKQDKAPHS
jgi:RNA polymerase sigma-70 factor (ECF subfamily)